MSVLLSYTYPVGNQIAQGEVVIDATPTEMHTASAEITKHQVEVGANIADHIRPLPKRLSLEGFISNVPIEPLTTGVVRKISATSPSGGTVEYQALVFDQPIDRTRALFGDLVDAAMGGAIFTVTTALKQYTNMAITQFGAPKDVSVGDSLRFSIELEELRFVESQVVKGLARKRPSQSKKPKSEGPKPAEEAPAEKRKSLLKKVVSYISGP